MKFDIFFSISQTPVQGHLPSEREMFLNFFSQVKVADQLGFDIAWIAESHFSSEVQKKHKHPVVPHWQGEIGLNTDIFQLAQSVFSQTKNIYVGSAVMNIVCQGGPLAAAERLAYFAHLHGLSLEEQRKIYLGFSAGRFEFMNRNTGIQPRDEVEACAWPVLKGKIFQEATEIFLRMSAGEELSSDQLQPCLVGKELFRSADEWQKTRSIAKKHHYPIEKDQIHFKNRWQFEVLKIIPQSWRRELFQPVVGSHDPQTQIFANQWYPTQVFNLSITPPAVIEETHKRMSTHYHPSGGPWQRSHMPRTVFVFLNHQEHLSNEERSHRAQAEAQEALGAYWTALEGTLDPQKVAKASNNALVGNAHEVAQQILERFHPEDRLMLWFDFFNHDNGRVLQNMEHFMEIVVPLVKKGFENGRILPT